MDLVTSNVTCRRVAYRSEGQSISVPVSKQLRRQLDYRQLPTNYRRLPTLDVSHPTHPLPTPLAFKLWREVEPNQTAGRFREFCDFCRGHLSFWSRKNVQRCLHCLTVMYVYGASCYK